MGRVQVDGAGKGADLGLGFGHPRSCLLIGVERHGECGHDGDDRHHDDQFDESETALADRPSLAPLHDVRRETSLLVHGNIQEKWRAPRRKLSAGARTVPDLVFLRAVGRRSASPEHRKISAERSLSAMTWACRCVLLSSG